MEKLLALYLEFDIAFMAGEQFNCQVVLEKILCEERGITV